MDKCLDYGGNLSAIQVAIVVVNGALTAIKQFLIKNKL